MASQEFSLRTGRHRGHQRGILIRRIVAEDCHRMGATSPGPSRKHAAEHGLMGGIERIHWRNQKRGIQRSSK